MFKFDFGKKQNEGRGIMNKTANRKLESNNILGRGGGEKIIGHKHY